MISILISFGLGILVIVCLILKIIGWKFSNSFDVTISVIIPILCLFFFFATIVETSIRRNSNNKEMDELLSIVELSLNSDRIFASNEEKDKCIDSLMLYSKYVNVIAYNDSLITLIVGKDTCMQRRIRQTNDAISQSIEWISQLNNLYSEDIKNIHEKHYDNTIEIIGPGSDKVSIFNIAFRVSNLQEHAICAYVQVKCSGEIYYSQAFELKSGINCFNIPTFNQQNEIIELGYICIVNDKLIFKYTTYEK